MQGTEVPAAWFTFTRPGLLVAHFHKANTQETITGLPRNVQRGQGESPQQGAAQSMHERGSH